MYRIILLMLTSLLIFTSCSSQQKTQVIKDANGVTMTINESSPTGQEIKFEPALAYHIKCSEDDKNALTSIGFFDFDRDGNIYIQDSQSYRINKYNNKGDFVSSFGKKGSGPGEFNFMGGMVVSNDTIFVSDWRQMKVMKFDLSGSYVGEKVFNDFNKQPAYPTRFGNKFLNNSNNAQGLEGDKMKMTTNLMLFNEKFNLDDVIFTHSRILKNGEPHDPEEGNVTFACSDNEIYVSKASIDKYLIEIFNNDGKKTGSIEKKYVRKKANPEDAKKLAEEGKKWGMNYDKKFVKSVMGLMLDKYNNLWVYSPAYNSDKETKDYYEIFKNGVFVTRKRLFIEDGFYPIFKDDKIVGINRELNEIKVYNY